MTVNVNVKEKGIKMISAPKEDQDHPEEIEKDHLEKETVGIMTIMIIMVEVERGIHVEIKESVKIQETEEGVGMKREERKYQRNRKKVEVVMYQKMKNQVVIYILVAQVKLQKDIKAPMKLKSPRVINYIKKEESKENLKRKKKQQL